MEIARVEVARAAAPAADTLPRQRWLVAGATSGLLGGAVMALFLMLAAGVAGTPWLQPLAAIGTTFVGAEAPGAGAAAWGAALHALTSAALGLGFAAIFPRDLPPVSAAVVGAGYAFLAMAIMASLVVPLVNPAFAAAAQPAGGAWVVAHALFGTALGLSWARWRRAGAPGPSGASR
jgi:hypothetical protein